MSGNRISLADGFEDLLGTLRGLAGECPAPGEIKRVDGSVGGLGHGFYRGLKESGMRIAAEIALLNEQLASVQSNMAAAIADQRETDASIADDLKRMLAELEDVQADVAGEESGAQDEPQQSRKLGRAK